MRIRILGAKRGAMVGRVAAREENGGLEKIAHLDKDVEVASCPPQGAAYKARVRAPGGFGLQVCGKGCETGALACGKGFETGALACGKGARGGYEEGLVLGGEEENCLRGESKGGSLF